MAADRQRTKRKHRQSNGKKPSKVTGSLAANAHEGSRSEYLAQYFFSAFGPASAVQRQEDSGLDLWCGLGDRIGQRLLVTRHFVVQVKSNADPIQYRGKDSVKWLLSHRYPILVAVVSKGEALIEVFHTQILSMCTGDLKPYFSVSLLPGVEPTSTGLLALGEHTELPLGKAIIRCRLEDLSEKQTREDYRKILDYWVAHDQENIDRKQMGLSFFGLPGQYDSNSMPTGLRIAGNYRASTRGSKRSTSFFNTFWILLAHLLGQASEARDSSRVGYLTKLVGVYIAGKPEGSFEWISLVVGIANNSCSRLKLPDRITLQDDFGTGVTPKMESIEK